MKSGGRPAHSSSCLVAVRAALRGRPGLQLAMSTLSGSLCFGLWPGVQHAPGNGLQSTDRAHCAPAPPQQQLQRASALAISCMPAVSAPHRPCMAVQHASRAVHCCAAAPLRSRRAIRQHQQYGEQAALAGAQTLCADLYAQVRQLQQLSTEAKTSATGLFDPQLHTSVFMQEVPEIPAAADNPSAAQPQDCEQHAQTEQQDHLQHQQQQPWHANGLILSDQQQQHLQYLRQHTLPSEALLVGVDPDTNGAIAVVRSKLHWSLTVPSRAADSSSNSNDNVQVSSRGRNGTSKTAGSKGSGSTVSNSTTSSNGSNNSSNSTAEVLQLQAHMGLPAAVSVYDMPVETIVTQSKTSTGKRRVRRRLDILQTMAVIRQVLQDVNAATADTQPHAAAHATSPSSSTDAASSSPIGCDDGAAELASSTDRSSRSGSGGGASASSNGRVLLRAVVEVASILPSNGRLATLNQGYSVGAWTALLASHGFDVTTVHVLSWKKDMGLLKRDKDSSRQLAKTLFRQAGAPQDDLLRTKNTHGRAEALLLAAWGLGWAVAQGAEGPSQGALRATLHMDGGQHSIPLPQHQQQQMLLARDTSAAAAAADVATSDDESSSQLLCMPSGMGAAAGASGVLGVVTRAHLARQLQPLSDALQQQQRILDVGSEMAAAVAAVEAKAAARQAEREQKAAARKAAAEERAAARAAEKAAKASGRSARQRGVTKATSGTAAVEEAAGVEEEAAGGGAGVRRRRKQPTS